MSTLLFTSDSTLHERIPHPSKPYQNPWPLKQLLYPHPPLLFPHLQSPHSSLNLYFNFTTSLQPFMPPASNQSSSNTALASLCASANIDPHHQRTQPSIIPTLKSMFQHFTYTSCYLLSSMRSTISLRPSSCTPIFTFSNMIFTLVTFTSQSDTLPFPFPSSLPLSILASTI